MEAHFVQPMRLGSNITQARDSTAQSNLMEQPKTSWLGALPANSFRSNTFIVAGHSPVQ